MTNRFKKSLENLDCKEQQNSLQDSDVSENILDNILKNLPPKESQGKSVALYLSAETDEAVSKLAKQKGISKSKLVDKILKQVLF